MKRLVLTLFSILALTASGYAQNQPETVRKLVKLQHVQTREVSRLLEGWIRIFPSVELATILLQGTPEEVAKAEEVIREVDRPGSETASEGSVEVDAYFLSAGSQDSGAEIPPLVQPVVAELQKRFTYAHYGLLDSTLVQVSVGTDAFVWGQFAREGGEPISYRLQLKPTQISGAAVDRKIKLAGVEAQWSIPYMEAMTNKDTGQTTTQTRYRDLRIHTDVSVPEGKLVVVGKAGSPTAAEAIFLVLRARLVE